MSNLEIKEQLLFVSNKIDEAIRQYRETKSQEINTKRKEESFNSPNYIGKINTFKSQVESLQKDLEEIYNINKVNQLESEIKKKEKILKDLKGESNVLKVAVKEQNKGINEYLSKFDSTKEQKELSDQIKTAKEENHTHKEIYKGIANKIKTQKNKIEALEKKCKIIKQNIEFQKKKQMKEVQKTFKDEKSDGEEDEFGGDVNKMEEVEKNLIDEINIEEKNFRMEINEQNDRIKKLRIDMNKIDFKIKNLRQEKKLDEIKKKNRTKGRSTTKYQPNSNNTANKNMINRDNKRRLSNYKQKESPNINNNIKNNRVNYTDKRTNLKTPNFVVRDSEKFTKPFEIKKFNDISSNIRSSNRDEKNYTMFENKKLKLAPSTDNASNADSKSTNYEKISKKNNNKGISALKEIEILKNEIQNALKTNIVILNNNEDILSDNHYYNDIYNKKKENKDKINNFSGNRTGGFGNNKLNDIKKEEPEEDNVIDYNKIENNNEYKKTVCFQNERRVKDYQINGNDKSSEEINKRKPFEKIIFK